MNEYEDLHSVKVNCARLIIMAYMGERHPLWSGVEETLECLLDKAKTLGVRNYRVITAYVIAGLEYQIWYEKRGKEELEITAALGEEKEFHFLQRQAEKKAMKKAIDFCLGMFEGYFLGRILQSTLYYLGIIGSGPHSFGWYEAELKKIGK